MSPIASEAFFAELEELGENEVRTRLASRRIYGSDKRPIPSIRAGCQRMTADDYAIIFVSGQAFTVGVLSGSGCLGRV